MDDNQIFDLAKKTYEEKNYDESLKYITILLDKNLQNDYLYQIAASIHFEKEEYKKALDLTETGYKLYKNQLYITNKVKILNKLSDKKYYSEKTIFFIREILEDSSFKINEEILDIYISTEDPQIFISTIIKLFQDSRIQKETYSKLCIDVISKHNLSSEIILPLLKILLEKEIEISIDNDNILIENLSKLTGKMSKVLAIYYLTTSYILNDNKEKVDKNYKKTISNLKKLIQHFNEGIFDDADEFYSIFKDYFYYYFVYYGYNNVELYKLVSTLLKKLCPDLKYTKSFKPASKNKIKIGFISSLLTMNHSVCKDRVGIIKSLTLDDRFETYIITKTEKEDDIYKFITNNCTINKLILPENIKESRITIDSYDFDIIVYPEIGMDIFFYILAHSRLAPIQINTWGHSETSGIDTIDYYFSSKYYETEKMAENYSEKLVLLDSLCTYYYSLDMFDFINTIKNTKSQILVDFNLPSNCNLYGSLQSAFKYQPENINSLKNILCNDPKAIIILVNYKGIEKKIYNYLEKKIGYHMNRVRIFNRLDQMDYCKMVSIVDIILDSFPFGGCNTSLDAFYFNKIVITLPSNKLNGRFTYGFYKKMGIEEPICTNLEEFSVKALYYMNNKEERLKIEKMIEKNKHVLYQEEDSISTWKNKLIELYENKNDKKSKK